MLITWMAFSCDWLDLQQKLHVHVTLFHYVLSHVIAFFTWNYVYIWFVQLQGDLLPQQEAQDPQRDHLWEANPWGVPETWPNQVHCWNEVKSANPQRLKGEIQCDFIYSPVVSRSLIPIAMKKNNNIWCNWLLVTQTEWGTETLSFFFLCPVQLELFAGILFAIIWDFLVLFPIDSNLVTS